MRRIAILAVLIAFCCVAAPARAYVEAPMRSGPIVAQSTNICSCASTKVDKAEEPHHLPQGRRTSRASTRRTSSSTTSARRPAARRVARRSWTGPRSARRPSSSTTAAPARRASAPDWYQAYPGGEWWTIATASRSCSAASPASPRSSPAIVADMRRRQGSHRPVHGRRQQGRPAQAAAPRSSGCKAQPEAAGLQPEARLRRLGRRGLPPARRHARLHAHSPRLARVDPDAQAISVRRLRRRRQARPLPGRRARKVALLQNDGESLSEVSPARPRRRRRAAVWADYNGDGKPDLLLATADRAEAVHQPRQRPVPRRQPPAAAGAGYNLTAAAWLDHDGDGKPDILLGQRLPRPAALPQQPAPTTPPQATPPEARAVALRRPVRQRRPARASTRVYPAGEGDRPEEGLPRQAASNVALEAGQLHRRQRQQPGAVQAAAQRELGRLPLPRDRSVSRDRAAGLARQRRHADRLAQRREAASPTNAYRAAAPDQNKLDAEAEGRQERRCC